MRAVLCHAVIVWFWLSAGAAWPQSVPAAASHQAASTASPQPSPEAVWRQLMAGNQRFVEGRLKVRELSPLRRRLAQGQSPKVVILGCSDSRVSPELLFDQSLGDLFVVRTAGNIADAVGLGSIEYAVEHFDSTVIVVLGHEECGAVKAACSHEAMPSRNLEAITAKIAPACSGQTGARGTHLSVEANVRKSARDLIGNSAIVRERVKQKKLSIIMAVYELDTGKVIRLRPVPEKPM